MINRRTCTRVFLLLAACVAVGISPRAAAPPAEVPATLIASGLQGASGSTVGPDGALYVVEGAAGRIARVDPVTGAVTTFATGLPPAVLPIGGAMDIAFIGWTPYVLVSLVFADPVGIYRIDSPTLATLVADIGAFALANPPQTPFDVPIGLQFALESYRNGFLVTDGHLNRVYRIALTGGGAAVSEFQAFGNIVPTGLAVRGEHVLMAEAGPVPHLPADGRIVLLNPDAGSVTPIAAGAPLLVDVEFGRGQTLFALAQGTFGGGDPGAPALPNTGLLVQANADGTFTTITSGLNLPTSLEFIGNTAFVVTLAGEVLRIELGAQPLH